MPIIESAYKPSWIFKNGFISTVYSGIIRKVKSSSPHQRRERLILKDDDFIDLDWNLCDQQPSKKLVVLLHGLEGNAERTYMTGAANLFNENNYDVVRVNYRGCSGEENRKYSSYHSGATSDFKEVLDHVVNNTKYTEIYLKGFSLGGNVILKYLGESENLTPEIMGAVAISVPCELAGSAKSLLQFKNIPYAIRFKRNLLHKLRKKQQRFPERISNYEISKIKTLIDFDDAYTSKAHGFKNAQDYYQQNSSLQFLPNINIPTLLINSLNDSFLSPKCYPIKEAEENPNLYLEMPQYGGHVGFHQNNGNYYSEERALQFFDSIK